MTAIQRHTQFSVFKAPITGEASKVPTGSRTPEEGHQLIKSDTLKARTEAIRTAPTKEERSRLKTQTLPFACFSATVRHRSSNGVIKHSGLISIDCDDLTDPAGTREQIIKELPPLLVYTSPSGKGLKLVYCIDIPQEPAEAIPMHAAYFKALQSYFYQELGITVDPKCGDIARAAFLCHDPAALLMDEPAVIDQAFIDTFGPLPAKDVADPPEAHGAQDYTPEQEQWIIDSALKMLENRNLTFIEGSRHAYIEEFSGYCNRRGLDKRRVLDELLPLAEPGHDEGEIKSTINSIYGNKKFFGIDPLTSSPETDFSKPHSNNFPCDGFPTFIQQLIAECTRTYGFNSDLWAAAFFSAAASAIGQAVILKTKYENPPLFWLAVVGQSGTGKTEPFRFAFEPLHNSDSTKFKAYTAALKDFEATEAKKRQFKPSLPDQILIIDSTPESLADAMSARERGITIEREELAGWIADFGRYHSSGEQQTMLSTWSQATYKVSRVSGRNHYIREPFCAVVGGMQPELLPTLAADGRDVNGFLPRFMFVFPDRLQVPDYNLNELRPEQIAKYHSFINALLSLKGYRVPVYLDFDSEQIYADFFNHNAKLSNSSKLTSYEMAVNSKLNIIALRIAVLFHVMNGAFTGGHSEYILPDTMTAAVKLAEYFRTMQSKVSRHLIKPTSTTAMIRYLGGVGYASQTEIAKVLGVTQQMVSKTLKGCTPNSSKPPPP